MASLSFAVAAWRFGVPASRAGARGVVEDEVARGALAALQAGYVDLAELQRDLASQRCRGRGFAPLELCVQYPVLGSRRTAPSRCSVGQAGSAARPAGLPSARSEDRPPAERPFCEARVARPAGGRPGAAARVFASLLRDWRGGRGGSRDHGQAYALRSCSQTSAACPASDGVADDSYDSDVIRSLCTMLAAVEAPASPSP